MSTADVIAASAKATQACVPCRKQKRKCDKGLPACGLCSRMGRLCDYSDAQQAQSSEDLMSMRMKIVELERRLNQKEQENGNSVILPDGHGNSRAGVAVPSAPALNATAERPPLWVSAHSEFPSAMFLDIDCFSYANLPVPKPAVGIPKDVREFLGDANALELAVKDYFNTIHCWFPIISIKRMNMDHAPYESSPDLAMLLLAMKLVSSQPANGAASAEDNLYIASKSFLALLESSGTISITYLQAMVLVAIYEFGHSIYPAAWMTIGACARYAEILGLPLHKDSVAILGQAATWTELEERRRVWWGIFILDRVVCLGNRRRPAASEPGPHDILPMDDTAWDKGDLVCALHSTVSAPLSDPQAPFARLCQAAMLIDRVESHIRAIVRRHRARHPEPFSTQEVDGLINDLSSFSSIVGAELAAASADTPPPTTNPPRQDRQPNSLPFVFPYLEPVYSDQRTTTHTDPHHRPSPQPQAQPTSARSSVPSLLQPHFLAFSALILLYDLYSCPEEPPHTSSLPPKTAAALQLQSRAVAGIRSASLSVRDAAMDLLEFAMLPSNLAKVGPLVLDSIYAAMATLRWLWREGWEEEGSGVARALEDVKRTLARLDMRWRLARDYLGLERYLQGGTCM